jgi:hypothetical protein
MKQTITLSYTVTPEKKDSFLSEIPVPRKIEFKIDATSASIPEILEQVDCFIKAMGFNPPDAPLEYAEEEFDSNEQA